jgi:hypothetical protein
VKRSMPSSAVRLPQMSCASLLCVSKEVEAACAERKAWCVSPFIRFRISGVNLTRGIRAINAVSETPTTTHCLDHAEPVRITLRTRAFS